MNEKAISQIEQRWLRASPGPWTIIDYTVKDNGERVAGNTQFERYKNAGICSTIDEYVAILESQIEDLEDFASLADRCRIVVAMSNKDYYKATERVDCGKEGAVEPSYSFAVGPQARAEDVDLVRHAASDIGKLLAALQHAQARIEELEEDG